MISRGVFGYRLPIRNDAVFLIVGDRYYNFHVDIWKSLVYLLENVSKTLLSARLMLTELACNKVFKTFKA
jgi:hypothetical protein